MYRLPKPHYDPETMRAVAVAYRRERQARRLDEPASEVDAIEVLDIEAVEWTARMAVA